MTQPYMVGSNITSVRGRRSHRIIQVLDVTLVSSHYSEEW